MNKKKLCGVVYSTKDGRKGATCANPKPCLNTHLIKEDEHEHDFRFSHYERGDNFNTYLSRCAIMVCKNCGQYIKQQVV